MFTKIIINYLKSKIIKISQKITIHYTADSLYNIYYNNYAEFF